MWPDTDGKIHILLLKTPKKLRRLRCSGNFKLFQFYFKTQVPLRWVVGFTGQILLYSCTYMIAPTFRDEMGQFIYIFFRRQIVLLLSLNRELRIQSSLKPFFDKPNCTHFIFLCLSMSYSLHDSFLFLSLIILIFLICISNPRLSFIFQSVNHIQYNWQ